MSPRFSYPYWPADFFFCILDFADFPDFEVLVLNFGGKDCGAAGAGGGFCLCDPPSLVEGRPLADLFSRAEPESFFSRFEFETFSFCDLVSAPLSAGGGCMEEGSLGF